MELTWCILRLPWWNRIRASPNNDWRKRSSYLWPQIVLVHIQCNSFWERLKAQSLHTNTKSTGGQHIFNYFYSQVDHFSSSYKWCHWPGGKNYPTIPPCINNCKCISDSMIKANRTWRWSTKRLFIHCLVVGLACFLILASVVDLHHYYYDYYKHTHVNKTWTNNSYLIVSVYLMEITISITVLLCEGWSCLFLLHWVFICCSFILLDHQYIRSIMLLWLLEVKLLLTIFIST